MRILHLNTYHAGGAGRAAYRLHEGLIRIGQDSLMLVCDSRNENPGVVEFQAAADLFSRIRRRLRSTRIDYDFAQYSRSRPIGHEPFSDDRSPYNGDLAKQLPPCDVINLHWVANFIDYQEFLRRTHPVKPVVWTLHDMNAFTGGCHYALECDRYAQICGACPQLGSANTSDLAHQIWQRKRQAFSRVPPQSLHFVAPSRWLAGEVKRSGLARKFPVSVIPNGVNTEEFTPRDRQAARKFFNIPLDAAAILFVSDTVNNRRKGYALLLQALAGLTDVPNLFLLSLGRGMPPLDENIQRLHFGHVDQDRALSFLYSAADLYVIPSIQDNLPNTVLEAMACGTPVVGFNIGGIPDMVRPAVTGRLVPAEDVQQLRAAISELLQNPEKRAEMSVNCRRVAVTEYALDVQARRYLELYRAILKEASVVGTCAPSTDYLASNSVA